MNIPVALDKFTGLTCRNEWKLCLTQDVVELIQVVFPRKDRPVTQHLSQDAAHWPDVNGLGVALRQNTHVVHAVNKLIRYPVQPQNSHQLLTHLPLSWAWFLEPCTNEWPRTQSRNLCGRARGQQYAPGRSHRSEDDREGQRSETSACQLMFTSQALHSQTLQTEQQ